MSKKLIVLALVIGLAATCAGRLYNSTFTEHFNLCPGVHQLEDNGCDEKHTRQGFPLAYIDENGNIMAKPLVADFAILSVTPLAFIYGVRKVAHG